MASDSKPLHAADPGGDVWGTVRIAFAVVALLFVFLLGVHGLGDGFKLLGSDLLDAFFSATANPLVALMVGLLATTLVQSSSVSTSMIVGLVAAPEHPLPLANAIPMVMGANIGTTVTNTVVSLAHMGRKEEFRRAFATATCHDFFNFIAVALLLPLELATGLMQRSATALAGLLPGSAGAMDFDSPLKAALKLGFQPVAWIAETVSVGSAAIKGGIVIAFSGVLIFGALLLLVRTLRSALQRKAQAALEKALGRSSLLAMGIGVLVTVLVQSSSITTSLLVPLAGAGLITLQQAFPVTLGANIGTTLTALLASLAVSGPNAGLGVTIALIHTLFNVIGTLLIFPFPPIRRIPLIAASKLADIAAESRKWAIAYVIILFYGLPGLFAFLDQWL